MNIHEKILEFGSDHLIRFGGLFQGGIRLQQSPIEFANFIEFLIEKIKSGEKINNYLEVGSASGGNVYTVSYFIKLDNIYIIDDNKHPASKLRKNILKDIVYTEWIGDSQTIEAKNFIKQSGILFDAIFIDADHSYNGVKNDTTNFVDFLRTGGYLFFHDILTKGCGIGQWTEELKRNNNFKLQHVIDFIDTKRQLGIGVFQKCQ